MTRCNIQNHPRKTWGKMKMNDRLIDKFHLPHLPFRILLAPCLLLLAIFLTSCAMHSIPPHLMNANAHPRFRPESYITAIGVSDRSLKIAQENAREEVSNQVHLKINAHFQSWEEFIRSNDKIIDKERLIRVVETRTSFARAEMIHIDQAGSTKAQGLYRAFAYLSRADIYGVFATEYNTAAVTFRRAVNNIGNLKENLPAFTMNLWLVQDSFAELQALSFKMYAVAGRWHEDFAKDQELFDRVEDLRVDVLKALEFVVQLGPVDPPRAREIILGKLTEALKGLIGVTPDVCSQGKYLLYIDPAINWNPNPYFGPECTLTMTVRLAHCDTDQTLAEFSLNDPSFIGVDTHHKRLALDNLFKNISVDKLMPLLQTGLSSVFPVKRGK